MASAPRIDEPYLIEWFEFGFIDLNIYLGKCLRFEEFYERRERGNNQEAGCQEAGEDDSKRARTGKAGKRRTRRTKGGDV